MEPLPGCVMPIGQTEAVLEEVEVNEDELVGYIARRAKEKLGKDLLYSDIRAVLDLEAEYVRLQGVALLPDGPEVSD